MRLRALIRRPRLLPVARPTGPRPVRRDVRVPLVHRMTVLAHIDPVNDLLIVAGPVLAYPRAAALPAPPTTTAVQRRVLWREFVAAQAVCLTGARHRRILRSPPGFVFGGLDSGASPTGATAVLAAVHVVPLVWVALGAVRLVALGCSPGLPGLAAPEVLALARRIQMGRVAAEANATQVVEDQPFGNRPDQEFVGRPVSVDGPSLPVLGVRPRAIAVLVDVSVPQPTARELNLVDTRPEARCKTFVHDATINSDARLAGEAPSCFARHFQPEPTADAYCRSQYWGD